MQIKITKGKLLVQVLQIVTLLSISWRLGKNGRQRVCVCVFKVSSSTACQHSTETLRLFFLPPLYTYKVTYKSCTQQRTSQLSGQSPRSSRLFLLLLTNYKRKRVCKLVEL